MTDKEVHRGEDERCAYGVASMQGWRTSMEDAHSAILELEPHGGCAWFAVFDGHGGKEVAKYCALRLHTAFAQHPAYAAGQLEEALVASFFAMDDQIRSESGRRELQALAEEGLGEAPDGRRELDDMEDGEARGSTSCAGCTSVVAVIKGGVLYVANAGDSRAVLCRAEGISEDLSVDHKPTLETEKARILAAGGFVADGRVKGSLALSRAIGDLEFKQTPGIGPEAQMVTALPDVRTEALRKGDEFLLLACDGIWDVMSSQAAVQFVRGRLGAGVQPQEVAASLCDACMAPDTHGVGLGCDNMSVVIVVLKPSALPGGA